MDTTASGTEQPPAVGARPGSSTGRLRTERVARLPKAPRFYLTYLSLPHDGSDPALPLGVCLVLQSIGGRDPRRVEVQLPDGTVRGTPRLRRGSMIGIATPAELPAVMDLGTVFVDWTSRDGERRTAWLRVPPVPARYRDRSAR